MNESFGFTEEERMYNESSQTLMKKVKVNMMVMYMLKDKNYLMQFQTNLLLTKHYISCRAPDPETKDFKISKAH